MISGLTVLTPTSATSTQPSRWHKGLLQEETVIFRPSSSLSTQVSGYLILAPLTTVREPLNESNYQKVTSPDRSQRRRKTTRCPHTGFLNTFGLKNKCTWDHCGEMMATEESHLGHLCPQTLCRLSTVALSVASSKLFECFSLVKIIMVTLGWNNNNNKTSYANMSSESSRGNPFILFGVSGPWAWRAIKIWHW